MLKGCVAFFIIFAISAGILDWILKSFGIVIDIEIIFIILIGLSAVIFLLRSAFVGDNDNAENKEVEGMHPLLADNVRNTAPKLKEYYKYSLATADRIVEYVDKVMKDEEMFDVIKNIRGIEALDCTIFGRYNSRVVIIVLYDLWKCYTQLSNIMVDKGFSNLCYSIAVSKFNNEVDLAVICNNDVRKSTQQLGRKTMDFLQKIGVLNHDGPKDFLMYDILNLLGRGTEEYDRLLHDTTECMAAFRGKDTIDENVRAFLNSILDGNGLQTENTEPEEEKGKEIASVHSNVTMSSIDELNSLIGLDNVKDQIIKLSNFVSVQKMRTDAGLSPIKVNCHCVFTGNPGTGKTTVARIMAGIYKELGVLEKGHLVETDRSGLVAEYVGQTAVKTNKVIDSALGGVLFIDEAYSLLSGSDGDYGTEALATLLKRIEDDRERLVVILAGYGSEMNRMIESNPGLRSRFNRYFHFPDYSVKQLWQIFCKMMHEHDFDITPEATEKLMEILDSEISSGAKNFGNARFVRNLFEKIIENQASRVITEEKTDINSLRLITESDLRHF